MSENKMPDMYAIRERAEDMRAERSLDYYAKLLVADAADVQIDNLTNGDVVAIGNLCSEYLMLIDALAAAEARVGEVESALADANSVATALSTLHTMKLIREGRTDGRDDFGPEVRAACERLQAFNERAAALRERGRA